MKIRVLSDLHREFTNYQPDVIPSVGEDLTVLAGDIGVGIDGITWAKRALTGPVVYILGNHEFYGHDWMTLLDEARQAAAGSNVRVLEDESFQLGDLTVLGCTLWSDFAAMGASTRMLVRSLATSYTADYRAIRHKNKGQRTNKLIPPDVLKRCMDSYRWLDRQISHSAEKLLVVTHNAPTLATLAPAFEGDWSAPLFHNDFDQLIRPPVAAWIHGHTHYNKRVEVNGVPVLSNQCGYPNQPCPDFAWDYCLEI